MDLELRYCILMIILKFCSYDKMKGGQKNENLRSSLSNRTLSQDDTDMFNIMKIVRALGMV